MPKIGDVLDLVNDLERRGDVPGHEFHGNQWTGEEGGGGQPSPTIAKITVAANGAPPPIKVDPGDLHSVLAVWAKSGHAEPLMNVQVAGAGNEHLFTTHARELSREQMPVVPTDNGMTEKFVDDLRTHGYSFELDRVDPRTLTATQNELDGAKVGQIVGKMEEHGYDESKMPALIVSKDGEILDGHHRWAAIAAYSVDHPGTAAPVIRVGASIDQLLSCGWAFDKANNIEGQKFGSTAVQGATRDTRPPNPDPNRPWAFVNGQWVLVATDTDDGVPRAITFPNLGTRMRWSQVLELRGDVPGHQFHGNQWTGGLGLAKSTRVLAGAIHIANANLASRLSEFEDAGKQETDWLNRNYGKHLGDNQMQILHNRFSDAIDSAKDLADEGAPTHTIAPLLGKASAIEHFLRDTQNTAPHYHSVFMSAMTFGEKLKSIVNPFYEGGNGIDREHGPNPSEHVNANWTRAHTGSDTWTANHMGSHLTVTSEPNDDNTSTTAWHAEHEDGSTSHGEITSNMSQGEAAATAEAAAYVTSHRLVSTRGDKPGHEFHGNQWTGGEGGGVDVDKLIADNPRQPGEPAFAWAARIVKGLPDDVKHEVLFQTRETYPKVDYIAKGADRYRESHGLPNPQVDLTTVRAPLADSQEVGKAFDDAKDAPDDPKVKAAYDDFKQQNEEMYQFATKPASQGGLGIKIDYTNDLTHEPYNSAREQADDLRANHHITTQSGLGGIHEASMSRDEYDRFRAVHDIFGHAGIGGGFDRHGEFQAWLQHMSMYTNGGRDAMSSEYHGVNAAMWSQGSKYVGTGKTALLPSAMIASPFDDKGNLVTRSAALQTLAARIVTALGLKPGDAQRLEPPVLHPLSSTRGDVAGHEFHGNQWTGGQGGSAAKMTMTASVISADEARGNSRPISADAFHALQAQGQKDLDSLMSDTRPTTAFDDKAQWADVKHEAYLATRVEWGGQTIDPRTGASVEPKAASGPYALTVRTPSESPISVPLDASEAAFGRAMDEARSAYADRLSASAGHLGVFRDDDLNRIDIDPVVIVPTTQQVESIGAYTHAAGGAYDFATGNGYFPPHVAA